MQRFISNKAKKKKSKYLRKQQIEFES